MGGWHPVISDGTSLMGMILEQKLLFYILTYCECFLPVKMLSMIQRSSSLCATTSHHDTTMFIVLLPR